MTYQEWRKWLAELPWLLKWFPLLILLRPVIDNLYFLKEVSPLLSPPYLIGLLTPLLCIIALIYYRLPRNGISLQVGAWSCFLLVSALVVLLTDPLALVNLEFMLKLSMPVYLYYFIRLLVTDLRHLHGVLHTLLYSAIIVAAIFLFEILVQPVRLEESRGLMRIQGSFGDVVSYGLYICFSAIIAAYYWFSRLHRVNRFRLISVLAAAGVLCILGLLNIHHTASYTVFIAVFGLFITFTLRTGNRQIAIAVILLATLVFSIWGSTVIEERIAPLVETDLAVYSGEKEYDQLLHGRVGRWRRMLQNFNAEALPVQLFGMPFLFKPVFPYIGVGSHNDFFRMMFAAGYAGLVSYLFVLTTIFSRAMGMGLAQKFLVYAGLIMLLFYSISITPTFYPPFLYFFLPLLVYAGLPANERLQWNGHRY